MQIKVAGALIPPVDTLVYVPSSHRATLVIPLHPEPQAYSICRPTITLGHPGWDQPEPL